VSFGDSSQLFHNEAPLKGILSIAMVDLIKDKSAHGGIIYTLLRRMEGDGLIVSEWDIQESGPARRIYRITEEGMDYLRTSMEKLRRSRQLIKILLDEKT
jgi:DNA-binding PadR family transcriptional regulator